MPIIANTVEYGTDFPPSRKCFITCLILSSYLVLFSSSKEWVAEHTQTISSNFWLESDSFCVQIMTKFFSHFYWVFGRGLTLNNRLKNASYFNCFPTPFMALCLRFPRWCYLAAFYNGLLGDGGHKRSVAMANVIFLP